jgi:SAM-dependent methyltransferase
MVAEADVVMAYRLLMAREPENPEIVRDMAKAHRTIVDLRKEFMSSVEFREKVKDLVVVADLGHKPLNWPRTPVDVNIDHATIDRMLTRIEDEFVDLGESEPHWSVVTEERFKASNIGGTEADFFESGRSVVDDLRFAAERCDIDLSSLRTCFELGCGLGRSTIWLAEQFAEVFAGDISPLHLAMARQGMQRFGRGNVSFFHLNKLSAYDAVPNFDVFFSIIVLQHNPPPVMKILLARILGKLNAGGLAYFQIPTYALNYAFSAEFYLETKHPPKHVEVHFLPQRELFQTVKAAGCEVLELREDGAVGMAAISNRLLLRKT